MAKRCSLYWPKAGFLLRLYYSNVVGTELRQTLNLEVYSYHIAMTGI